ncbi:MAG: DUF418 domain-containing protein [Woeseiaceae bacterium]|nr:DUF418 domain-containing protein [Woeseiaceae bacterium]
MSDGDRLAPIEPSQRLGHVDMVRGFALFGVMLVNMFNFGATSIIWTEPHDEMASSVMRFVFETKSWRLFSFLFGFGFALQFLRAYERHVRYLPTYIWRLTLLLGFGMLNALLYDGDILMYYAELGLVLILFRKVSPRLLLLIAAALMMVFPAQRAIESIVSGPAPEAEPFEVRLEHAQARNVEQSETHPYSIGTIGDVMAENAQVIPPNLFTDYWGAESAVAYFPMFLLGLYAGRRRILHEPNQHLTLIRRICGWGIGLGILGMSTERLLFHFAGYQVFDDHMTSTLPQFVGDFAFAFGSTALALGYAAGIVILARHDRWRRIVHPLAAVGRMALSIYLLQTLMFSTLFYGYAFGQVGRLGPAGVFFYAIVFFSVQIVIANWWLKRFRFGPAEWLWRSLTYRKRQPMRLSTE